MSSYYISGFDPDPSDGVVTGAAGKSCALKNTDEYMRAKAKGNGTINIVDEFSWFTGGSTEAVKNLDNIPRAMVIEREQLLSSTISQAIYYLNAIGRAGSNTSKGLSKFTESLGFKTIADAIASSTERLQGLAEDIAGGASNKEDEALMKNNKLASLVGLYYTKQTAFKYIFPYFENPPVVSNNWGAMGREGILNTILGEGFDFVEGFSNFINITQPGVYIQKPKHFQHSEEGPTITVEFPLFNTFKRNNRTPYQQNYELLWLLTYQNKTFKTSFGRSRPPKLYSVTIPGLVNMPYAHISNMTVDFLGTVRSKKVTIASMGDITASIPDAYNVRISFTSLLSDYANLMLGDNFTLEGYTATIRRASSSSE